MAEPKRHSLRGKLIALVLTSLVLVGALTLGTVGFMQFRHADAELALSQVAIRAELMNKGELLGKDHALALKSLAADNAVGDVTTLVKETIEQDEDVEYGLFVSAEQMPWVYVSPTTRGHKDAPKNAWQELGLEREALAVREPGFRSVWLFGSEIFEFATPVRMGDEFLGTIRYGISTAKMRAALGQARERSNAALERMLLALLCVVLLATGFGLFLSARRATTIVKPLLTLTRAANAFAAGDKTATAEGIECGDEVEELAHAFNGMLHELNRSYTSLETLNHTLEQKVEERTAALRSRNRDMALVLDNVDQGLITLSLDGVMAAERSRVVTTWFGDCEPGTRFIDYVNKVDANFALRFELNWDALLADALPSELCMHQMPRNLSANGRQYSFAYSEIRGDDGRLAGLLLVIMDVTEALARELEEAEQRGLLAVFSHLNRDRDGYLVFHRESARIMDDLCSGRLAQDLSALKRCIHTLKGNSSSLGLSLIASLCHQLEEEIDETNAPPAGQTLDALKARWDRISDTVRQLTQDRSHGIEVHEEDYQRLISQLGNLSGARDVLRQVLSWQQEPVQRALERLADRAVELARRLGKGELQAQVQADELRLDVKRWEPLWTALVHVVRNAVDHGLPPAGAAARNPSTPPCLTLSARVTGERLVISIADNGVGIDWERVRSKARELGLPVQTHEHLLQALLADGFSTATTVSEVSGRGIGLAAVREVVTALSGTIHVDSQPGAGTTWSFAFSESMLVEDLEKLRAVAGTSTAPSRLKRPQPPNVSV